VDDRPTVDTDPSGMCPIDNGTPSCMKGWKNPNAASQKSPFFSPPSPAALHVSPLRHSDGGMIEVGSVISSIELITDALSRGITWNNAKDRESAINRGLSLYGVPYVWGGGHPSNGGSTSRPTHGSWEDNSTYDGQYINTHNPPPKDIGFNCSSFVSYAYHLVDSSIWGTAQMEYDETRHVTTPIPGDLVFYNYQRPVGWHHVALYIGDGFIIDAPETYVSGPGSARNYIRIESVTAHGKNPGYGRSHKL
jgi:cell wall-associated NlpC family hydrolase